MLEDGLTGLLLEDMVSMAWDDILVLVEDI